MADSDEITAARYALGRQLAGLRRSAGHTQHALARLIQYGRSSIANTETGHQWPDRTFWTRCDEVLHTDGALARDYDQIAALARQQRQVSAVRPRPIVTPKSLGLWEPEDTIDARRAALRFCSGDDARLTYLEHEVERAIADNERLTPTVLLARVRPLRGYVDQLMAGRQHPPQRTRLYLTAVHLSGLVAALALDLGAFRIAHSYAAEAYDLADAAQIPDARAWARATQSLVAFYSGDYHDSLAYAQDGLRHAGTGPHRTRLAINGEARALARLGDHRGVDRAVDHAFSTLSNQPSDGVVSTSLAVGPYCQARTAANAATAYLILGREADVTPHLTTAIDAFDAAGLRGPQALSRLDLATAHLKGTDPDYERAAALAIDALAITDDQRYESVSQRARQFLATARAFKRPELRQVADILASRRHQGTSTPPALRSPT
ncbi:helix-turn-helix domain-containing protein [Micromonospora sp. WMMA1923]|uniref:helix-turn-helix transcriptional regulator n=1 Tax=Micromonospora sp. WMMA1923 TaxID=3404125 RepID=UPI003B94A849